MENMRGAMAGQERERGKSGRENRSTHMDWKNDAITSIGCDEFRLSFLSRHNSSNTSAVTLEVLGHQLQFAQEKNSRKGRFCPMKLKGKRAIELGAGCGLAGFGLALLGCNLVSTDQIEVLPLLMRNIERNTSRIKQSNPNSALFGSIEVAELDWGNPDHIKAVGPPFDYIIGTDIVYAEHLLEPLLKTIVALSGPRTTVLLGYEIRSTTVHDQMIRMWKSNFEVKTVPETKMDSTYRHPSIQLFIMGFKAQVGCCAEDMTQGQINERGGEEECGSGEEADSNVEEVFVEGTTGNHKLSSDWEARRYGSMAARLLRDVKTT
ncbi:uncharacterized protein LOC131225159 isoform X3 [Magnolia sinica]|uniref:uncharacterized protein LOC131225159 isoform X3 n=1 Tax=Magnolia sinica TaxID=86752 RepID=UPI00265A1C17|nr:uncharacterized protein LOC131225159 isoform X3 [Magnolia sinica]